MQRVLRGTTSPPDGEVVFFSHRNEEESVEPEQHEQTFEVTVTYEADEGTPGPTEEDVADAVRDTFMRRRSWLRRVIVDAAAVG